MISHVIQDIRFGTRTLLRSRGFTIVAVLTLALGIGVNSAMFSLVNAVLLRPLPFADPDRLVMLYETRPDRSQNTVSGHEFNAWREQSHLFEQIAIYNYAPFNLTGGGEPQIVMSMLVSGDFFPAMGVQPILGRTVGPTDARAGYNQVAVLSYKLWQQSFASDPHIAGKTILLDNQNYEVIGVMPARGDFDPDIWVAMDVADEVMKVGRHSNLVFGRLKPDVTLEQARAELNTIAAGLERDFPRDNVGHRVAVIPVYDQIVRGARGPVLILFGSVAFVLLIACANVAHLLLTRAAAREREIAIRTALGAGRGRLIAQLMTESVVLAIGGGALGLILAAWVVDFLPGIKAVEIPRLAEVRLDARVLAATGLITLLTGLISGVVPALRGTKLRIAHWLVEGARASAGLRGRIAGAFMISQVALALVLLIGAMLMLRSFARLTGVDPGFQPERVLAVPVALPPARFAEPQQQVQAIENLIARVGAIPGVQSVGTTTQLPLTQCCNNYPVTIEGKPAPRPGDDQMAMLGVASGDYFKAMGIPLRKGRTFAAADARIAVPLIRYWPEQPNPAGFERSQAAPVVVINEAMAHRYWPDEDPIGKRFRILFSPPVTVIGVVGNVRQTTLHDDYLAEMYLPPTQEPLREMTLVVRTRGEPMQLAASVQAQIRQLDRDIPIQQIRTMEDIVWESVGRSRFYATLLGAFGLLALVLSCVGIYGVVSYAVAQRTEEIGIRSALGARSSDVLRLVLGHALGLTLTGIGIGLAGAFALTRLLRGLLFEIQPTDPLTFAAITVGLTALSLLASFVPTQRAIRVDPMLSLRR